MPFLARDRARINELSSTPPIGLKTAGWEQLFHKALLIGRACQGAHDLIPPTPAGLALDPISAETGAKRGSFSTRASAITLEAPQRRHRTDLPRPVPTFITAELASGGHPALGTPARDLALRPSPGRNSPHQRCMCARFRRSLGAWCRDLPICPAATLRPVTTGAAEE